MPESNTAATVIAVLIVPIAPLVLLGVWCTVERLAERRRLQRCRDEERTATTGRATAVPSRLPGGRGRTPTRSRPPGVDSSLAVRSDHTAPPSSHGGHGQAPSGPGVLPTAV